jgi:hypothetical protein
MEVILMRLVDADAFKEYLRKGTEGNADIIPQRLVDAVLDIMDGIMLDIDEQPTIDAVPVVRCKDCKWFNRFGCAVEIVDFTDRPTENDYCSFGEREDDD